MFISRIVGLFEKVNLILKHVLFFTLGEVLVRRGFAWFIGYHYRFWLRAVPAAYAYFALGISLLIVGALLKRHYDVIAALMEFDLLEH